MPKFHVTHTFQFNAQNIFVLAGSVVEGVIRQGMFVHIPCNSALDLTAKIDSIEFARRVGGAEDVCLCFKAEPELGDLMQSLNLNNQVFEVNEAGTE